MAPPLVSIPGGRGRPRLPTKTKELRGTADKGRNKNPNEPKVPAYVVPPAPDGIDDRERASWEELREKVNMMPGVAAMPDMSSFRQMVHAHVVAEMAFKEILAAGVIEHGEKMDRPNPAAGVHATHVKLFLLAASQFGIGGAASRSRVSSSSAGASASPEDEFA